MRRDAASVLLSPAVVCGRDAADAPRVAVAEPLDLVVDIEVDANTLGQAAEQMSRTTGVEFIVVDARIRDRPLRDPYLFWLPRERLKDHLLWMEEMGLIRFVWSGGVYEMHVLDHAPFFGLDYRP